MLGGNKISKLEKRQTKIKKSCSIIQIAKKNEKLT